jgi:sugar/nucleoside kinase (ribokinase family)
MKLPLTLSENKEFDAVGFGLNAVDHLIVMPQYPEFDTKTQLKEHIQSAGGQTASCMVGLQRLGMKTAYAGRFGSDAEGSFGLQTLKDEGVDVSFVETIEGSRTQIAFIVIDEQTGERTIFWDRDDRLAYTPEEVPFGLAQSGKVLHMDAHDPLACRRMAQIARATGTITSLDVDNLYEGCEELLPFIDVLISSENFPRRLTGIRDEHSALIEIKMRFGCAIVGMTFGTRGSMLYVDGQFIIGHAYETPGGPRDTTGAGDAYHAGFIYGMLHGRDVKECMKLGSAVAALKCRRLGARTALPSAEELEWYLSLGMKPIEF